MKKKNFLKIFLFTVITYFIFAAIVVIIFNLMMYDPYDEVAFPYIYSDTKISEPYGQVSSIYRDASLIIENEDSVIVPYTLTTEKKFEIEIKVILFQENKKWIVKSLDIIEVREMKTILKVE